MEVFDKGLANWLFRTLWDNFLPLIIQDGRLCFFVSGELLVGSITDGWITAQSKDEILRQSEKVMTCGVFTNLRCTETEFEWKLDCMSNHCLDHVIILWNYNETILTCSSRIAEDCKINLKKHKRVDSHYWVSHRLHQMYIDGPNKQNQYQISHNINLGWKDKCLKFVKGWSRMEESKDQSLTQIELKRSASTKQHDPKD